MAPGISAQRLIARSRNVKLVIWATARPHQKTNDVISQNTGGS